MQDLNRIHLVPSVEPRSGKKKPRFDSRDIVRETLLIARECNEVVTACKSQLLIDLVASLAEARLRKRGAR